MGNCKYCITNSKQLADMGVIYFDTKNRPACLLLAKNFEPIIVCPHQGEKEKCELLKELNLV